MSSSKNLAYKKTSFLNKSNSAFIEQMYLKFTNKDSDLPESWRNYFLDIGEVIHLVVKEINGPTWSPQKKKINLEDIQINSNDEDQDIAEKLSIAFKEIPLPLFWGLGERVLVGY